MAVNLSSAVPTEYIAYVQKAAKLGLRGSTIFSPGDAGFSQDVIDIANMTQDKGMTAAFSRYNNTTASDGVEGVDYAGWQAFTPTSTSITATKKNVGMLLTYERLQKASDQLGEWVKAGVELGRSMAQKVNVDVCSTFNSFTQNVTSSGANITNAKVLEAIDTLRSANVRGQLITVLHDHMWYDLMSETSSALTNASINQMAEGLFMQYFYDGLYGMRWFLTTDVQTANAGADRCGAMFSPEAIGVAWKKDFTIETEWNKDKQAWEILLTCYYGVGLADAASGLKLVFDA